METECDQALTDRLRREAGQWHAVMHAGNANAETRERFKAWLQADKAHKDVYWEFEQIWRDLDFVAFEAGVDAGDLPKTSFIRVLGWRVAGWFTAMPVGRVGAAAVVATLCLVSVIAALSLTPPVPASVVSTEIAEIKRLTLPDGSVVTLGAKSKIASTFTKTSRRVTLLSGEAFFDVRKDEERPFFVAANDTLLRVVGTQFDVKHSVSEVHVSVLEGVVEVMKPDDVDAVIKTVNTASIEKKVLTAGEKVSVAPLSASLPDIDKITATTPGAWRTGKLAYKDASLAEIVTDMNRYRDQPIRFASADLGDIRFTAAFQPSEIDEMLSILESMKPITADRQPSGEIVLRRRTE